VNVFGPITQSEFLMNMGIEARLAILLRNCRDEDLAASLISGHFSLSFSLHLYYLALCASRLSIADLCGRFTRLVDPKQMGERYKVMAITNLGASQRPSGFDAS
jgi:SAM-dependent MidA family methyltransferase